MRPDGGRRGGRAVATARRVPLIRDDTGHVLVRAAEWRGRDGEPLRGEAVVDDTVLFDGEVTGVRVEPTQAMPGLRASVYSPQAERRWAIGRAAQLGTTGAVVVRDGAKAQKSFADLRFIATRRAGCW